MRFQISILFAVLLWSIDVVAVDAGLEYRTMQQLTALEEEKKLTCETLRRDPTCGAALRALGSYGLSTVRCVERRDAVDCDSFFAANPEFANRRATCSPYDVCKSGQDKTFILACKRLGFNAAASTWESLRNLDVKKVATSMLIESVQFVVSPTNYISRKGTEAGKDFIDGIIKDRNRLPTLACLNSDAQAEFGCYSAFKYGSLVVGTGAAARGAVALVSRMRLLEARLANPPRRLANFTPSGRELDELDAYIKNDQRQAHTITRDGNRVTLTIGYLEKTDRKLAVLMERAVRSGSIDVIDGGRIVGPRVLHLFTRLQDLAPQNQPLTVRGRLSPALLTRARNDRTTDAEREVWSQQDFVNFDRAVDRLGMRQACRRIHNTALENCSPMRFEFDARNLNSIRWTREY